MNILAVSKLRIFVVLITLYLLLHFAVTYLFNSLDIYIQTFQDQLSINRIEKLFKFSNKQGWLSYAFVPIIVFS